MYPDWLSHGIESSISSSWWQQIEGFVAKNLRLKQVASEGGELVGLALHLDAWTQLNPAYESQGLGLIIRSLGQQTCVPKGQLSWRRGSTLSSSVDELVVAVVVVDEHWRALTHLHDGSLISLFRSMSSLLQQTIGSPVGFLKSRLRQKASSAKKIFVLCIC